MGSETINVNVEMTGPKYFGCGDVRGPGWRVFWQVRSIDRGERHLGATVGVLSGDTFESLDVLVQQVGSTLDPSVTADRSVRIVIVPPMLDV